MLKTSVCANHAAVVFLASVVAAAAMHMTAAAQQSFGSRRSEALDAERGGSRGREDVTMVFALRSRPAREVAGTLADLTPEGAHLVVLADARSNTLILRGSSSAVESTAELLKQLDAAPKTVTIDVTISVVEPNDSNDGDAPHEKLVDHLQMTTLDELKASLQMGQQVAVATGSTQLPPGFGGRGGSSRSYQQQQTGTLIQATPRVMGNDVVLQMQLEKSWIEYPASIDGDDANSPLPSTYTATLDTTLHLSAGKSQTATAKVSGGSGVRELVITVSATAGEPQDRPSAAIRGGRPASGRSGSARTDRPREGRPESPGRGGFGRGRGGFGGGGFGPPAGRDRFGRPPADRRPSSAAEFGRGAKHLFEMTDKNSDGMIDADERQASPVLESLSSRGLDISQNMSLEEFTERFRKFAEATGRDRETNRPTRPFADTDDDNASDDSDGTTSSNGDKSADNER